MSEILRPRCKGEQLQSRVGSQMVFRLMPKEATDCRSISAAAAEFVRELGGKENVTSFSNGSDDLRRIRSTA